MAKRKTKKPRDPNNPLEWQVQRNIIKRLKQRIPSSVIAAVPNETRGGDWRALNEQQIKMANGACGGFPDLIVLYNGHVVFIEVKRRVGGKVTDKQKATHRDIEANGFDVVVMKGSDGIDDLIDDLLARPMGAAWCHAGGAIDDLHTN